MCEAEHFLQCTNSAIQNSIVSVISGLQSSHTIIATIGSVDMVTVKGLLNVRMPVVRKKGVRIKKSVR